MKKIIAHLLIQAAVLGMWTGPGIAGSWDSQFHDALVNEGVLQSGELVTAVTTIGSSVNAEVYISTGNGRVLRFRQRQEDWDEIASVQGGIWALSAVMQGTQKYLFVGGEFS